MRLAARLVQAPPSLRWHLGRVMSAVLYRHALAGLGPGSVIVDPRVLRGVEGITIGARTAIYGGAWLQCEPGGGPLTIGDDVYLGHDVHLHAIDPLTIGSGCVLADGVFIATTDHEREDRAGSRGTGPVHIGERVFIGQRAVILGGVSIGDGATIGAQAVVTRDVPAGAVAAGIPARIISEARP